MGVVLEWAVSVEEAEQPEWYLSVFSYFGIIACVDGVRCVPYLGVGLGIANPELELSVNEVGVVVW